MKRTPPVFAAVALSLSIVATGAAFVALKPGEAMTDSAKRFLATLDDAQRAKTVRPFEDPERLAWHFIPKPERKGLQLRDMNDKQRRAAHGLLRSALSQVGYDKARTVMELDAILRELEKGRTSMVRDDLRYYFTLFGNPAADTKWGLSVEGHHLSLNFVVENNQVVSHTPAFYGANPSIVDMDVAAGPARGTYVLEMEELLAFELVNMLSDQQRGKAVIAAQAPRDIRGPADAQAPNDPAAGIAASELERAQRFKLWALIHTYAHNMPPSVAEQRLSEIREAGLDNVHFAWAGPLKPGVGHYYRVQGPTFLIEFCNTQPDAAGNVARHPHTVWRDMRGDFAVPR